MYGVWALRLGGSRGGRGAFAVSSASKKRAKQDKYAENNYYEWPEIEINIISL